MKKFIRNILVIILVLGIMLVPSLTYAKDSKSPNLKKYLEFDKDGKLVKVYSYTNPELYVKENYMYNGLSAEDTKFDQRYVSANKNVTQVKDQGRSNSCWAFSGTSIVESYLSYKNNKNYNFSPQHIDYLTQRNFSDYTNTMAYNRIINNGGNPAMFLPYFINNVGPVSQSDVPFTESFPKESYNDLKSHKVLVDVNNGNIAFFSDSSADAIKYIKSQIVKYGSVSVSVHAPESESELYISDDTTGAWYDDSKMDSNHQVTLVGWDDNYSASNFKRTPAGNGAWIMLNSWGEEAGDKGYYYVSYYDNHVYQMVGSVSDIEQNVETNTYYYTEQFPISAYGWDDGTYVATIFDSKTKDEDSIIEEISEITIGYINDNASTNYKIYINSESADLTNIKNKKVAEGTIQLSDYFGFGYYTVHLKESIKITGDKFAVVVEYNGYAPTTENDPTGMFSYSSIGQGKVFISPDASQWADFMSSSDMGINYSKYIIPVVSVATNSNLTGTDFVNSTTPTLEFSDTNGYDRYTYTSILTTNVATNELAISIVDSAGKDSTSLFEKNIITNSDNYKLVISNTKDALAGKYTVTVSIGNKKSSFDIVIYPDALISEIYGIDQSKFYIYKVSLNTTYSNFKKNFSLYGAKLYDGENLISDDTYKMKTNNLIKASTNTYKVAINGDLNSDGICDGNDTTILVEAIMEVSEIDDIQRLAGDVNGDNKSNAVDILLMRRYIAGLKNSL